MVRNKNGISAVVAVILTILITVVGVGIIWGAILPMIKNSASFSDLDIQLNVVKSGGYTFWDEDAGRLYVQVSRGVDEVDMTGVKLIVSIEGTTVVYPDQTSFPDGTYEVPGVNGKRTYVLNVTERPDSVKAIALVVVGKNEKEISSSGALNGLPVSSASDGEKELSVAQSSTEIPVCDSLHLDLCGDSTVCDDAGGSWNGDSCDDSECSVPADCDDSDDCTTESCVNKICSHVAVPASCPDAGTASCGEVISSSNGCGSCSGTGILCDTGKTCVDGGCVDVPSTEYVWQENGGTYVGPNPWNYVMGYKFIPEDDKYVTELCRYSNGNKVVYIYDENYQILDGVSISSTSAEWACEELGSPLLINSGDTYYVAVILDGSNGYYQSGLSLPKTYNGIEIIESIYKSGTTLSSPFKTTSNMYGLADIGVMDA